MDVVQLRRHQELNIVPPDAPSEQLISLEVAQAFRARALFHLRQVVQRR